MNWVPLCTLQDYNRIVGVSNNQVLINSTDNYKRIEIQEFEIPLCKGKYLEYEKYIVKEQFVIETEVVDKNKKFMEIDKFTMGFYVKAVDEGDNDKAFAYGVQALLKKTQMLLVKYAQELNVHSVAERLAKHFHLSLPSRFTRPEKVTEQPLGVVEIKKIEEKTENKEVAKENYEKSEIVNNPFSKTSSNNKSLFDALASNTKRKPENNNPPKKLKK